MVPRDQLPRGLDHMLISDFVAGRLDSETSDFVDELLLIDAEVRAAVSEALTTRSRVEHRFARTAAAYTPSI